jgi:hypothetical protein
VVSFGYCIQILNVSSLSAFEEQRAKQQAQLDFTCTKSIEIAPLQVNSSQQQQQQQQRQQTKIMLGTRRKDLPQNRPIQSKVYSISEECIELKSSISLTSSSSCSSDDNTFNNGDGNKNKVSNFMKNAAPSVVTKYINMNKMNSPFVESSTNKGGLYQKSIFSAALAVKTGKSLNGDVSFKNGKTVDKAAASKIDKSTSSSTKYTSGTTTTKKKAVNTAPTMHTKTTSDSSSYKTDANSTSMSKRTIRRMKRQMMMSSDHSIATDMSSLSGNTNTVATNKSIETLTPLQRRVLKVKKFKDDKGSIGKAAGHRDDKEIIVKVKKNDYQAWKAKRASKLIDAENSSKLDDAESVSKVIDELPEEVHSAERDVRIVKPTAMPSANNPSKSQPTPKTTTTTTKFNKTQYELLARIKASPPPPPPPPPQPKLHDSQHQTPFDENNIHHDKVEIVAMQNNETVIIDKSRNMEHAVRCEHDDASKRRMELLQRARSLVAA